MANLDSFIYRVRAQTSRDPGTLTVTREQGMMLVSWAKSRKLPQDKVEVTEDNVVKSYKGIPVRVKI